MEAIALGTYVLDLHRESGRARLLLRNEEKTSFEAFEALLFACRSDASAKRHRRGIVTRCYLKVSLVIAIVEGRENRVVFCLFVLFTSTSNCTQGTWR